MPGFHQLLFETGHPKTGDVAVFRYPLNREETFIKRIVGLPGDKITYSNKIITIESNCDRKKCDKNRIVKQRLLEDTRYQEHLGSNWHSIQIDSKKKDLQTHNQWVVPTGHYFVMGDNRDNSDDSRYWGFVSQDDLVGKAVVVWLHLEFDNGWLSWLPSAISFENVGSIH